MGVLSVLLCLLGGRFVSLDYIGDRLRLIPGKYRYKWVVDGVFTINRDLPVVMDDSGNENNQVEVEEETGSQDGDSDSWEKVSIPECEVTSSTGVMSTSVTEQISVVERIFSMDYHKTMEALQACGAQLVKETECNYVYLDTKEFTLIRRGVWLRRREEGGKVDWQLRQLDNHLLRLLKGEKEVMSRLGLELGQEVVGTGGSMEEICKCANLSQIVAFNGQTSLWRVGSTEVEVRREGDLDTVLVRVVGDIASAFCELQSSADRLLLQPLHMQKLAGSAA